MLVTGIAEAGAPTVGEFAFSSLGAGEGKLGWVAVLAMRSSDFVLPESSALPGVLSVVGDE